jgi:hypothetical protein
MIKVKEYLDRYFYSIDKSTSILRKNGHYGVFGDWSYPKRENMPIDKYGFFTKDANYIKCCCNNETIQIFVIINGKSVGLYSYLQTYEHIPRGEPDSHGYYRRSTDEEVIKYIDGYYQQIYERYKKLKKIKNIINGKQTRLD